MTSTTMTIRIPIEVQEKLSRLAQGTRRSRSFLAGEAVAAYVERELAIVEGIHAALADVAAGRVVSHAEAMRQIDTVIAKAKAARG